MYLFITVCLFLFLGGGWGEILFFRYDEVSWKQTGSTFFFFVKELERKKENCQSVTQIPPPPHPGPPADLSYLLLSIRCPPVLLSLCCISLVFHESFIIDARRMYVHTHTQRYTHSQRPTR